MIKIDEINFCDMSIKPGNKKYVLIYVSMLNKSLSHQTVNVP